LIENEIPKIEDQILSLNNKIEKEAPSLFPAEFREITNKIEELKVRMDKLKFHWLELDEKD
jgi:hypothetical protein